jgi:hypothetical protein
MGQRRRSGRRAAPPRLSATYVASDLGADPPIASPATAARGRGQAAASVRPPRQANERLRSCAAGAGAPGLAIGLTAPHLSDQRRRELKRQ